MNFNDYTKETFTPKLVDLYNSRWKSKKKSQKAFAKAMNDLYEKYDIRDRTGKELRTCTHQQVSQWLNGTFPDKENIRCISEVLDVDPEYFTFAMKRERAFHDPEYVNEEDRLFGEDLKTLGVENSFFEFLINRDHFSTNFPFHPGDIDTPVISKHLDSGIRSKRRFEYKDGDFRHCVTMSRNDLLFIKDIQDEIERVISKMFWDKFEEYRREHLEYQIKHQSEEEELPIEVVRSLYEDNRDWFIRTNILLRHQLNEDLGALDDLIWNYRVENKIPIPEKELERVHYDVIPDVDEMNKLRHEDRDELERKALEVEDQINKDADEIYMKRIRKLNKAIMNGTAKKVERRK